MCERTYERYDENEYFLKYLSIHPILIHSLKKVDQKKRELQLYLLDELNKKNISYEELNKKYNIIIEHERQGKIVLDTLRYQHKNIEKLMLDSHETNMTNIYNLIIKNKKNE